jgi:phosphate-selective porin OprO and OprP
MGTGSANMHGTGWSKGCPAARCLLQSLWVATGFVLLADTRTVWASGELAVPFGDSGVELKPYILNQFDFGGTWDRTQDGPDSGFNVRRLRYGARAKLPHDLTVGFIWDFGGAGYTTPQFGRSRLYEAKIEYAGLEPFTLTAGAFEPIVTLEHSQSSADTLFMSNATIVDLASGPASNGGRTGVQLTANRERWLLNAALTGPRAGPGDDGRERALLARAAGLIVHRDGLDVHLGLSGVWEFRTPQEAGSRPAIELSNPPEYTIISQSYLSTGQIPASSMRTGGLETGVAWGPLWLQGEWYRIGVDRTDGKNPWFSGWYAQAGWTLLGTPRRWEADTASWAAPSPRDRFSPAQGHWGALELGARFSTADLNSAGIEGGRQTVWSAAVNWWPTEATRTTLEWIHADVSGPDAHHFQAIMLRLQIYFE